MGTYYAAVDKEAMQIIHPYGEESMKWPSVIGHGNKFASAVMLANHYGSNFVLIDDVAWGGEGTYDDPNLEDVSAKWYAEYKSLFT